MNVVALFVIVVSIIPVYIAQRLAGGGRDDDRRGTDDPGRRALAPRRAPNSRRRRSPIGQATPVPPSPQ